MSVSAYTSSGCSTAVVVGLSKQIADEIGCMSPSSLQQFSPTANLVFSSNAVLPYLGAPAKTALLKVGATSSLQINSAFRTVAQQYLLYRWYQQGRCGITAAATPGRSNHQSGRALDVSNYSSRITVMGNQGWAHDVPGDPVHFDHLASPDIRGMDVKAFQRLWNRNNPADKISEDGSYGPQTEARLKQAPATGFTTGAVCGSQRAIGADVVSINGPDRIAAGGHATYSITVDNTGTTDWADTTRLVVMGGAASQLYDSTSWTSPTEVGPIRTAIAAGDKGVIDVEISAPMVTEETAAQTQFALSDGTTQFGTINLAVTITPNGDEDISNEGDDTHDDAPEVSGGCNASGNGSWLVMLAPALVMLRRRRRAS
ncbi:MAG: D-alanyl-D-alanine carboxypeptidase family protein [Myxococcales bacterium]|nr:D-alanyl-D-alanine carboxypeptidase family protein [Myxococcales bacterium]